MYGSTDLLLDLDHFFNFLILYTVGRTLWTGDQPVAMPLPTHRTTQTQNKPHRHPCVSGIRTHDPSVWASEDSSCLRQRGHCDRQMVDIIFENYVQCCGNSEILWNSIFVLLAQLNVSLLNCCCPGFLYICYILRLFRISIFNLNFVCQSCYLLKIRKILLMCCYKIILWKFIS
jgi:hypothetical protein